MHKLALNESASHLALEVAATLALRGDPVLLLRVVREQGAASAPAQRHQGLSRLRRMNIHEDDLQLGVRLASAAQVAYLILVCPEDVFGCHPTAQGVASVTLSRVGRNDAQLVRQLVALVDHAQLFCLETLWVEVLQGRREWSRAGMAEEPEATHSTLSPNNSDEQDFDGFSR